MSKEILTGTLPGIDAVPVRVGPSLGPEFNLVRAFLIPKACFKLEDAHFAFDSSFVTPDEFDVAPLKALLDQHPGTKLSIFGHADPTGDDVYNKTLSGRRASAILGLLIRDVAIWETLHNTPAGGDNWKPEAEQTMRATTGLPAGTARGALIKAYMDHLCTVRDASGQPTGTVELTKDDFLARGKGQDGKGDVQGCSEFNPLMIFSADEKAFFDAPANHPQRNQENQVNRRVMVLLFRPGSLVDPAKWPCPTVKEGTAKCLKRFHSDGETRRSNQAEHREFKNTKDTFACRFYDRISNSSPCEGGLAILRVRLHDAFGRKMPGVAFQLEFSGRTRSGRADEEGFVTDVLDSSVETCVVRWEPVSVGADSSQGDSASNVEIAALPRESFAHELTVFVPLLDIETEDGVKRRLHNLGYTVDGEHEGNLRAFQAHRGLDITGQADEATKAKLESIYAKSLDEPIDPGSPTPVSAPASEQRT